MYLTVFVLSLLLTLLIEVSLSLIFGVRHKGILVVVLVNMLTNPVAVCLYLLVQVFLSPQYYLPMQIFIEVLVVLVEGSVYQSFRKHQSIGTRPWLMSLTLNIVSYSMGLFINS